VNKCRYYGKRSFQAGTTGRLRPDDGLEYALSTVKKHLGSDLYTGAIKTVKIETNITGQLP
jgi:hypothetical protein